MDENQQIEDFCIEITVTNECNCRCDYCFECSHENTSTSEEEQRQIDLLIKTCEMFDSSKYKSLILTFWGGEPMRNFQFLKRLIDVTYKYPFIRYMMYSNGTLISTFQEFLKQEWINSIKNRFEIQLSYDGQPIHSKKRHIVGDVVLQTARLLVSNGFYVSFKATLPFDNIKDLPEVWDSYNELYRQFPDVSYCPTLDQTNANNIDEAFDTWKQVLPIIAKKEIQFIKQFGHPLWRWFEKPGKLACSLNNSAHVNTDGNIYVCHACPHINRKDLILGNTKNASTFYDYFNYGMDISLRDRKCVDCSAVACQVCHVSELMKRDDMIGDYKDNWTKIMVNSPERCRFFKYFGMVYHAMRLAILSKE